ncbi:hypothetical protein SHKM778_70330 [Streptomyces sp. KM77-8]|uniref:Uncharacterized protein n=1 Tax=Streptomyces haneummycinicus TaxID=3074435 RepID=A0AAT9HT03_9ACTN
MAGGEDDGVGGEAGTGALLGVFEVEFDAVGAEAGGGADPDGGGEDGVGPAAVEGAPVELVVDGVEGAGVDGLVELPLGGDETVADGLGQGMEVAGVVGGELFEAEPGVLHGGKRLGAAGPVEPFTAGGAVAEQVEEDLGTGLSGADDGDVAGGEEPVAVGEVVVGVDHGGARGVGEGPQRLGHPGFGADAEDEVPGVHAAGAPVRARSGEVHLEQGAFGVPADGVDAVAEVQGREVAGDPAAVGVVLGAADVEPLGEVEGVEALAGPEVVEEGPGAGGVGEGDEVGEEGDLDGDVVEEQAGVPGEAGVLVVEGGVQSGEGMGQRGEGEVEGADADADEVVGRGVHGQSSRGAVRGRFSLAGPVGVGRKVRQSPLEGVTSPSSGVFRVTPAGRAGRGAGRRAGR